jgi:hypothetical protein
MIARPTYRPAPAARRRLLDQRRAEARAARAAQRAAVLATDPAAAARRARLARFGAALGRVLAVLIPAALLAGVAVAAYLLIPPAAWLAVILIVAGVAGLGVMRRGMGDR